MKRNIRFALCLLAFTTAVAFSGCTGSEKPLGSTETESTPTVQTQRETEPAEDDLRLWGYITYRETSTLMKVTLFDEYQGYETVYVDVSGLYTHCEIEWEIFFTFDTTREPEMLDGIPVFKATYAETYAPAVPKKPVIYLYPETATVCSVKLTLNGHLTCTYPAYRDGWTDFTAHPDGTLIFPDGKEYYCLYWEGIQNMDCDFTQGFCVKGEDTAAFLEWALAAQGLTPREANEFIIYWLPRMEGNTYNVIAFQTEAYTEGAVLEITPAPDSLLRVFMAYYPTEEAVEIEPQSFAGFERNGFTVVEWGGCAMGTP